MGELSAPQPLAAHHDTTVFDSGEPTLDDWLRRRALSNAASGASRTYVVCDDGHAVVAYYALAVGAVDPRTATGRVRRNMPDPIPVMVIGRLAVDQRQKGKGIARGLVRDAIMRTLKVAETAGVRALLVHAISEDAARFWIAMGFVPSPLNRHTLMVNLADATAAFH